MRTILCIFILLPCMVKAQQLYIGESALVHISDGANLEVGGDLENDGAIQNLGTLSLYGDWPVNNNFNGLAGTLQFLGGSSQTISPPQLTLGALTINQMGSVTFPGDEYVITDQINLLSGTIKVGENTRFILGEDIRVNGGSNDSYFEGTIIARGSGIKTFPVGADGVYSPLTLLDVFGNELELATSFSRPNSIDPIPGDSLLGVSDEGFWEVELLNGVSDETSVLVEFNQVDLSSFNIRNDIRHLVNSPVIAYTPDLNGEWRSLGVSELLDSDSVTFGTLTAEIPLIPIQGQRIYLAVGLAPRIPSEGLFFIPEAFSPNATDPDNQTFRIFGERIAEEDFSLRIYNRLGVVVYETDSFAEANQNGWDGNNLSGAEEPTGVYYYSVRMKFDTGLIIEKNGAFYLVK